MCGIFGVWQKYPLPTNNLNMMLDSINYRGPDDKGILKDFDISGQWSVYFGHRRLSIIDLSAAGCQPMVSNDKNIWITFNGEIYNFLDLKKNLIELGYKFNSHTDTEVLIYGYQQYGTSFFSRINGMFAFAIYDRLKRKLILVRDRFGQKPLYYWFREQGICFASELGTIMQHPDFEKKIDYNSLNKYLLYEYFPRETSILENVYKLLPGHYLEFSFMKKDYPKLAIKKYWEVNFYKYNFEKYQEEDIIIQLNILFEKAVKDRLMSDVPIGIFLSGGLDSSSILATMSKFCNLSNIKTFSIGFEEKSFDESSYAQEVASYFGAQHHKLILNSQKILDSLPSILEKLTEPLADPSLIPTYLLSKFTSDYVKVAIGGDGGDELFAGYDTFLASNLADYYQKIPPILHRCFIKPLAQLLPISDKNMSFDFKLNNFLKGVYNEVDIRNQIWLSSFSNDKNNILLKKHTNSQFLLQDIIDSRYKQKFRDNIDILLYMFQKFYLAENILVKVDRASMLNSLEVRSPFLDVNFAEYVNSLSSKYKYRNFQRKYILKKMFQQQLPPKIIKRPKKGFGIPLSKWIKKGLKEEICDTLNKDTIKKQDIFDYKFIYKLLEDHFSGKKNNAKKIWTIYTFEKWLINNIS